MSKIVDAEFIDKLPVHPMIAADKQRRGDLLSQHAAVLPTLTEKEIAGQIAVAFGFDPQACAIVAYLLEQIQDLKAQLAVKPLSVK